MEPVFKLISTNQELLDLLPKVMGSKLVAIDTETTGLSWINDIVVGFSFSLDGETGYYVPVAHKEGPNVSYLVAKYFLELVLLNPEITRIFHNAKFDIHMIWSTFGIRAIYPQHDTLLMGHLINNTIPQGLKDWSNRLFGPQLTDFETRVKNLRKTRRVPTIGFLSANELSDYAAADALYTFKLYKTFGQQGVPNIYQTEISLLELVINMERRGVRINPKVLTEAGELMDRRIPEVEKELNELVGRVFNPRSPKQVGEYLFKELKFPIKKYTATGKPSADEETLLSLPSHPAINLILEARTLSKTKSTYIDGILSRLDSRNYLHCHFNQAGAETGRFSSSKPNLQNIPREGRVPVSIRSAFIPSEGRFLAFLDYAQIEMRLFAHYSGDPGLIEAVRSGFDFHRSTAALIFGLPPEKITSEQRKYAKTVNFGYIYGIGARKLGRQLGIPTFEAKRFLRSYDLKFPGVPKFMAKCRGDFQRDGYVLNMFGRMRYIPYDKAYRATNTLIQGTAADLLKHAMVKMKGLLRRSETKLILTIHDELVFDVPWEEIYIVEKIQTIMEDFQLRIPVNAEILWSDTSWAHKRPWEEIWEVYRSRELTQ